MPLLRGAGGPCAIRNPVRSAYCLFLVSSQFYLCLKITISTRILYRYGRSFFRNRYPVQKCKSAIVPTCGNSKVKGMRTLGQRPFFSIIISSICYEMGAVSTWIHNYSYVLDIASFPQAKRVGNPS